MVWKIKHLFAACLLTGLLLAVPVQASAYSVYPDGNISTTYLSIFEDVINKLPSNYDYVFFRSNQYEYTLIAGELSFDDGTFTAESYDEYLLTYTQAGYGQTSVYDYSKTSWSDLLLDVNNRLVYSNLGDYPDLIERGSKYEFTTISIIFIMLLCFIIRPVFEFVMRNSSSSSNR